MGPKRTTASTRTRFKARAAFNFPAAPLVANVRAWCPRPSHRRVVFRVVVHRRRPDRRASGSERRHPNCPVSDGAGAGRHHCRRHHGARSLAAARTLTQPPPPAIHHGTRALSRRTDMTKFIVTAMALLSAACPAGAFVSQRHRSLPPPPPPPPPPIEPPTDRRGHSSPRTTADEHVAAPPP